MGHRLGKYVDKEKGYSLRRHIMSVAEIWISICFVFLRPCQIKIVVIFLA